jgi:BirA family biotin operon repressor/biotin-[acetyl-CoA-carboxylase] ligase
MADYIPELPAAFELIHFKEINDLRAKAVQLSKSGKDEGTIIWASSQTNARGRRDQEWCCNSEDLHCTIILRPEFSREKYPQMVLVSAVSMANALAAHLSAMTALGFNWPNDINIAKHKVAAIWLDYETDQTMDNNPWLNITTSVNIQNSPEDFSIPGMSISEAEGGTEISAPELLEIYARQFITQINQWSERGMEYISRQWKIRAENINQEITINLKNERVNGIFKDIGDNGEIQVELSDNTIRTISLADSF